MNFIPYLFAGAAVAALVAPCAEAATTSISTTADVRNMLNEAKLSYTYTTSGDIKIKVCSKTTLYIACYGKNGSVRLDGEHPVSRIHYSYYILLADIAEYPRYLEAVNEFNGSYAPKAVVAQSGKHCVVSIEWTDFVFEELARAEFLGSIMRIAKHGDAFIKANPLPQL